MEIYKLRTLIDETHFYERTAQCPSLFFCQQRFSVLVPSWRREIFRWVFNRIGRRDFWGEGLRSGRVFHRDVQRTVGRISCVWRWIRRLYACARNTGGWSIRVGDLFKNNFTTSNKSLLCSCFCLYVWGHLSCFNIFSSALTGRCSQAYPQQGDAHNTGYEANGAEYTAKHNTCTSPYKIVNNGET